jgi:choline dehydrogenase-like flavoprotein
MTGDAVTGLLGSAQTAERVRGVRLSSGREVTGSHVLLAAGAMHSPRLLQRYLRASGLDERLPGARLVGCYFKRHLLTALIAFSPSRKTDAVRKTTVWLSEEYPHSSVQPLGFGSDVIASLLPKLLPRWLAARVATHAYGFFLQTEDGSDARNRVVAEGKDGDLPQLDYDPARLPESVNEHRRMVRSFRLALLTAGHVSGVQGIGLAGTAHACGTLVTGHDPKRSVVDPQGRVHGFENLYVVDGSILPRSARVNPSLTIYAWALRSAEQLARGSGNRS